jgi:superfamily II DNA or RNA helicase
VIPGALREWFDADGTLAFGDPGEVADRLRKSWATRLPNLRISQDVAPWIESRRREEERRELRRQYEMRVQSGEWPAQETRVPLFPYQREGMLHLAFTERALLADEMGLGKTIQAIAACALLRRLNLARRVLVVTPASLKAEWEDQIGRFTDLSCHVVFGGSRARLDWLRKVSAQPEAASFFTVMNYEQVVQQVEELNELLRPDVVILDEAQRIKNWNTLTARTIKQLRSRYAFILTGTPIENRIDELRSLVDFLDPSILGPLFRFNREFYEFDEKGRPIGCQNLDVLHRRVHPILMRRRKADVETQLPPRLERQLFVPLSPGQRRTYAIHEQEVMRLVRIAERRPLSDREQHRLQIELAMMRMTCDTNFILDPAVRECPKLPEIMRVLEDSAANGAKTIVFSEWERMLSLVRDACQERKLGYAWHTGTVPQKLRRAEINRFKSDPSCVVFLSTDSGAVGLNLQDASVVVNCDLPWNPARLEQRIARAWRKFQPRSVTVVHVIAENTIEHRMLDTLAVKRHLAESVLDRGGAIRSIPIRSGRKAMTDRLRELVGPAEASQPGIATVAHDPAAEARTREERFTEVVRGELGPRLVRCEISKPTGNSPAVLLVVVRDLRKELRDQVETLARAELAMRDAIQPLRVEVMDAATHDAVHRLLQAGVLKPAEGESRVLFAAEVMPPRPSLSQEQQAKVVSLREQAARQIKLARLLLGEGFPDEARGPLLAAALGIGRSLAIAHGLPQPAAPGDLLQPPLFTILGDDASVLQEVMNSNRQMLGDAIAAFAGRLLQD